METREVALNAAVGEALIGVQAMVADSLSGSGDKVKMRERPAGFCGRQNSTQTHLSTPSGQYGLSHDRR
jgi:predicted NAD/FAD-dependent oxidoreductase